MPSATVSVQNLQETIRVLRALDSELAKAYNREVYAIGRPVRDRARSLVPTEPPLSGWSTKRAGTAAWSGDRAWSKRARTGITVKRGAPPARPNQMRRNGTAVRARRPLLYLEQKDAAGAIFDMAGRSGAYTRGARGQQFNRALTERYGRPSRSLYTAVFIEKRNTMRALQSITDRVGIDLSRRLA